MNESEGIHIPAGVTVACPVKNFQQRYLRTGCLSCEYFKGTKLLTDAEEMPVRNPFTSAVTGSRPIKWHEKNMIVCTFPMTRRCSDMSVAEEE